MAYTDAELLADLDFLAGAYNMVLGLFGTGAESGTISGYFGTRKAALLGCNDGDALELMIQAYNQATEETKAETTSTRWRQGPQVAFGGLVKGLRAKTGTINNYLAANGLQVHPYAAKVVASNGAGTIDAGNIFALVTELGTMDRGVSAWTFTDGASIDMTACAPAQFEAYVPPGYTIGAASCVLTVTCKLIGGTTQDKVVTVPNGSIAGTAVDIGTGVNLYWDVTLCTATGGTSGDRVQLRSKQLRALPF